MRTVGVSFFLSEDQSIWNNGGIQNCVHIFDLLTAAGYRVFAINGGSAEKPAAGLMLGDSIEFVRPNDVADQLDLLIECGAQLEPEVFERVHAHGGKCVAYKYGNAYVIDAERIIHGKPSGAIFNGSKFDEVWTNAQHMRTCASYWETMYRAPVRCMPHIWSPRFIEKTKIELAAAGLEFGYKPGTKAKRIAIFEPNINIVKTCIIPLLGCELVYRRRPELIDKVLVTNAEKVKSHLTFANMAGSLDIVKAKHSDGHSVTSFEGRFNMPYFLAKYTDIVIAHQWENGLNYAYYDALYGGYPLVHNSKLLPNNIGYQYDEFDARSGASALLEAIQFHDRELDDYKARASTFLQSVDIHNKDILQIHATAIDRLFDT